MYFKGDILITDPMYIMKCEEDWHRCEYGENLEELHICTYLTSGCGDEIGCDVVSLDTHKKLGEFCSDSCMVSIMSLVEVKEYNPEFAKDLGKNCYTIIKDFEGEVHLFEIDEDEGTDQRFYFAGKGNKNFRTDFIE